MTNDNFGKQCIGFYRAWSAEAAEQALAADHPGAKTRCAHSATIWTHIADAIEAGQSSEIDLLTNNLLLLTKGCFAIAVLKIDARAA